QGLSKANADDAAYYLAVFYHQNGFAAAAVLWEIRGNSLTFSIIEGSVVQLRSTGVSGNHNIPSGKLLSLLTSPTVERLRIPENRIPFVKDELEMGTSRILDYYRAEGFLDVSAEGPTITMTEGQTGADVFVSINEGRQYRFGAMRFRGSLVVPETELRKVADPITSLPFTVPRQLALQSALQKFYTNLSHYEATVTVEGSATEADPAGLVPLTISIRSGPAYWVDGMDANGLVRLRATWLHNRMATLLDRPYDPERIVRKQQDLLASGLFDALNISSVPVAENRLRLKVELTEAKAREVGFSMGYGTYEGLMGGVRLSHLNLFGQGLQGSVELNASQRALSLETTISDPWLFETRTEFVARAFVRSRLELGYEKHEAGAKAEVSRRIFQPLQAALFGQIRTVEIANAEIPTSELGMTSYQIGTAGFSTIWDKRDNAFNPSRGYVLAFRSDTNTLSNGATFERTSGRVAWHYPLPARIRFGTSARFGILSKRSSVPIDERYFLGDSTTVRSFQERELGPISSNGYPTGGSSYTLINAESDFPLWQNLRGALFFDTGSLSLQGGQLPVNNFRNAVGLGLRYALPVGPVRFDLGLNPDQRPGEHWGAAHLSFGFAF
ncbi:MAG: BamA/TamA family outer membrane protein, partial [Verrucomicrobiota bacterium]